MLETGQSVLGIAVQDLEPNRQSLGDFSSLEPVEPVFHARSNLFRGFTSLFDTVLLQEAIASAGDRTDFNIRLPDSLSQWNGCLIQLGGGFPKTELPFDVRHVEQRRQ